MSVMEAAACLAVLLGVLYLPGMAIAWAWRVRPVVGIGAAPAFSVAVIGIATLVAQRMGIFWNRANLVLGPPLWLTLAIVCLGLFIRLAGRARGISSPSACGTTDRADADRCSRLMLCAALAGAAFMVATPMLIGTGSLTSPAQASDAVYHLSATRFVRTTGDASFLGGLAPMYDGASTYYPTAWHAIAAILPGDVISGANIMVIVLCALVWPTGMAAIMWELPAVRPAVRAVATALSASVIAPILLATSVWPYALSVVLMPGALALVTGLCGLIRDDSTTVGTHMCSSAALLRLARLVFPTVWACCGVVMAHGAGVFNLAVLALPLLIVAMSPIARRVWAGGGRGRLLMLGGAGLLIALVGAGAWMMRAALSSVFSFPRGAANMWETLFAVVSDHPLLATFTPWVPGNVTVLVLACLAVHALRRLPWNTPADRRLRGVTLGWLLSGAAALALLLLASGPAWPGRILAGPWYTQRARIMPLLTIAMLVLAAVGLEYLCRAAQKRLPGLTALAAGADGSLGGRLCALVGRHVVLTILALSLILAPGWRWPLKVEVMEAVHRPAVISYGAMLSGDELAMIRRLGTELPADAVVVGDPSNGSAYLWSVAGVRVLYPSRPEPSYSRDLLWVGKHLGQIGSDPRVCTILGRRGVGYYYSDSDSSGRQPLWGDDWDIDPAYLIPVDKGGSAALWRINYAVTPCGAMTQQ